MRPLIAMLFVVTGFFTFHSVEAGTSEVPNPSLNRSNANFANTADLKKPPSREWWRVLPADTIPSDSTLAKSSLNLKDLQVKDLIQVLDTIKNRDKKYTLDPDSVFFGFSTGASFEFVDGLDDASLFIDLTTNIGQILEERVSAEFGVLSGRFAPTFSSENVSTSVPLRNENLPDNVFQRTVVSGVESTEFEYKKKFTRAFATGNYRVNKESKRGTKLYLTARFEYSRLEFDNTVTRQFTPQDTTVSTRPGQGTAAEFSIALRDTLKATIIQDRTAVMAGARLFKRHQDFEFRISAMFGHTWINEVNREVNSSEGRRIIGNEPIGLDISSDNNLMYIIKGSVLEKKLIGAKIGFEIRNMFNSGESPEYYFFISKQFSMQEFFRLFTPGG